jgi:YesN/AraC family two-component response regulator
MACVLVIDDQVHIRMIIGELLKQLGHTVYEASNGKEGMRIFCEKHPELVITDILMPEKDGLEVIMEIKNNNYDTKIVAISGGGIVQGFDYLSTAKKLGADKVLKKPFEWDEFINVVNELIEKGSVPLV